MGAKIFLKIKFFPYLLTHFWGVLLPETNILLYPRIHVVYKAKKKKLLCCPLPTDRKMRKKQGQGFFFFFFFLMSDLGEEFAKICIQWPKKALA